MKEKQFLRLPAQGNIYSTTRLDNVILIGSGNFGKILAYSSTTANSLDELSLTTVPPGVDIISIEAVQGEPPCPMLGLTYIQKTQSGIEEIKTGYLNIYADWPKRESQSNKSPTSTASSGSTPRSSTSSSPGSAHKSETVAEDGFTLTRVQILCQRCVSFKLSFIPYHLYHVGNVFLLSASDRRIHAYEPVEEGLSFANVPVQKHFPELEGHFPAVVTRIQIELIPGLKKRITLVGCEDGTLRAFIVSDSQSPSGSVFSISAPDAAFPVPKARIPGGAGDGLDEGTEVVDEVFTEAGSESGDSASLMSSMNEDVELGGSCLRYSHQFDGIITSIQFYTNGFSVNAIVSSANSPVYVYTNTLESNFETGHALRFSSKWDCVEAICVADLDFDGQAEIAIGTFGCTLLIYKFMEDIERWVIVANRKFPSAIFHIEFSNFELHVVTGIGLHVIEYSTGAYFLKRGIVPSPMLDDVLIRLNLDDQAAKDAAGEEDDEVKRPPTYEYDT